MRPTDGQLRTVDPAIRSVIEAIGDLPFAYPRASCAGHGPKVSGKSNSHDTGALHHAYMLVAFDADHLLFEDFHAALSKLVARYAHFEHLARPAGAVRFGTSIGYYLFESGRRVRTRDAERRWRTIEKLARSTAAKLAHSHNPAFLGSPRAEARAPHLRPRDRSAPRRKGRV